MSTKRRTRKSKAMETESPVTSAEHSPVKQPVKKRQKVSRKNVVKQLAVKDVNGRMVTAGTCEIKGTVIANVDVQTRNGRYGQYNFSQCTLVDEAGNSIDVKSYKNKAASDADKYEKHREIHVVFETQNVVRGDLRYNCAANKFHIRNPSRITMTTNTMDKKLSATTFEIATIESIQESATFGATKQHLSGIVLEINEQKFNGTDGLVIRINDETGSQRHVFYDVAGTDAELLQEGQFAFIWNAVIQKKETYVNSNGGVCLDTKVFKSLKKRQKTLTQALEQNKLYQWEPKEYNFTEFTVMSIQKANSLARKCEREEDFELKDKYREVVITEVEIEDFENLSSSVYLSARKDGKHKKLTEEEISELTTDEMIYSWMLKTVISDGTEEFRVTLFNSMGDSLMKITAEEWEESSEAKRQKIVGDVFKSKFNIYLTLQKKQYQGKNNLKTNVVKVEVFNE